VPTNDVIESIDEYCKRLSKTLHKVPAQERDDLVREVRSHVLERVEAEPRITPEILAEILRAVGEPKELAAEYLTQTMLREATRGEALWVLRPWILLRATLRWGVTSIAGLVTFIVTVIGYGCATVFLLCGLLKPAFPARIGLWLAPQHTLTLGYWNGRLSGTEIYGISVRPPVSFVLGTLGSTDGPVRELLGKWLIPVGIVCGALFFVATSIVARRLIARFRRKKKWTASLAYAR
jgi:hypothetical protein